MKALHACAGILALGLVVGCGASGPSGGSTATVQGSVSPSSRPLDNARAVAIGADGRVFWAYLDARGAFTLQLPVGQSYRVVVANALAGGGQRTIGHLVVHPSTGATRWMGMHQPGTIALGALSVPGAVTASTGGTVTTMGDSPSGETSSSGGSSGEGSSSGDSSGQDDVGTHEDDGETGSLCSSQGSGEEDDQELDAEYDPGDRCSDDDKSEHEHESDNEDGAPCAPADAGGASGSSGGSSGASGSGSSSGSAGGGTSYGGACTVSADCAAGLSCIASTCQTPIQ